MGALKVTTHISTSNLKTGVAYVHKHTTNYKLITNKVIN